MRLTAFLFMAFVLSSGPAAAQQGANRFQLGAQLSGVSSGEFSSTDVGLGFRFSWQPISFFGAEAEVDFYPANFPRTVPFSRSRVEGLLGVTAGPRIGRIRPFAKLRPGFVAFREAPGPTVCILIFPPPLSCSLAAGGTAFALDFGGGVEFLTTGHTFVRVDLGDRLMRYPNTLISHDFRFAVGAGARF